MHSFPMSAAKHFYDNPLSIYLDPKIVLIYRPHPVGEKCKDKVQYVLNTTAYI